MDRNRLLGGVALGEILALEHSRDCVLGRKLHHPVGAERHQPFRIERDFGLVAVEDQKHLVGVGLRVVGDFVSGEGRARRVASGGIADHPREIADQEDDVMSELLQLAELVELDRMAEMEVGTRRIESFLDLEGRSAR